MITLSSHTSCALQPLDVNRFKPFKTTFKKEKNNAIVRNNHCELNKIAFANWVEKALNTSFDAPSSSFMDSNVSPNYKQRKSEELRYVPWLATL